MTFAKYWRTDGACQVVAAGDASAASTNAFGSQTRYLRIVANTACHYKVATTPTAAATDSYLPANVIEIIEVTPGQKIAAIKAATGGLVTATVGSLWVTELSN